MMEKSQNLDTKNNISKYEPAPIAKRLLAGIMDGVVFIFTFLALALWVFTPIADAALHYNDTADVGKRYQLATHLYLPLKTNDDGNIVVVDIKDSTGNYNDYYKVEMLYNYNSDDPSFYLKRIYYYYHNFKCNVDIELPTSGTFDPIEDHFASPEYNKEINGLLPVNYYVDAWFSENILRLNNENSLFKIDETKDNYLESITVKEGVDNAELFRYLKNEAYEAVKDFYYSDYLQAIEKYMENVQYFIFLTPFALSYGIFFILIPLLMKDGQTLGKKSMNIAVISIDGYKAKKRQILFREILLFLVISVLGVVVGIGLTSLAVIAVGVVILFIATLIPKNKRSIFDYAAFTIVIDSLHSVWFKNKEDEEYHKKQLEDNMSKYKKYIPDNPNLIQVGSKVVDEKYLKEINKENNKKDEK